MEKKRMNLMEFIGENPSKSKAPKKRPATDNQVSYAKAIADVLGLDCPDFKDFNATSAFISENKDDYYEEIEEDYFFPF